MNRTPLKIFVIASVSIPILFCLIYLRWKTLPPAPKPIPGEVVITWRGHMQNGYWGVILNRTPQTLTDVTISLQQEVTDVQQDMKTGSHIQTFNAEWDREGKTTVLSSETKQITGSLYSFQQRTSYEPPLKTNLMSYWNDSFHLDCKPLNFPAPIVIHTSSGQLFKVRQEFDNRF